jgi:hypothetical protein
LELLTRTHHWGSRVVEMKLIMDLLAQIAKEQLDALCVFQNKRLETTGNTLEMRLVRVGDSNIWMGRNYANNTGLHSGSSSSLDLRLGIERPSPCIIPCRTTVRSNSLLAVLSVELQTPNSSG